MLAGRFATKSFCCKLICCILKSFRSRAFLLQLSLFQAFRSCPILPVVGLISVYHSWFYHHMALIHLNTFHRDVPRFNCNLAIFICEYRLDSYWEYSDFFLRAACITDWKIVFSWIHQVQNSPSHLYNLAYKAHISSCKQTCKGIKILVWSDRSPTCAENPPFTPRLSLQRVNRKELNADYSLNCLWQCLRMLWHYLHLCKHSYSVKMARYAQVKWEL